MCAFSRRAVTAAMKARLVVDAVIILNREESSSSDGMNLLNGLQLSYQLQYNRSNTDTSNIQPYPDGGNPSDSNLETLPFATQITQAISIPEITYDLNIFNRNSSKSEILARPSLLVEDGGHAKYFSGNQLTLGIEGEQTGEITNQNYGINLDVSPHFNKDGSIDLHVIVGRTLIEDPRQNTTFNQVVEAVKENTETNVNLRYGETVILSSLSERNSSSSEDQTPGLADIPLLKYFFSKKTKTSENNNILILLTPKPYYSFDTDTNNVEALQQLNKLYNRVVNPQTNINSIIRTSHYMSLHNNPIILSNDLYDPELLKAATHQEYEIITEENQ